MSTHVSHTLPRSYWESKPASKRETGCESGPTLSSCRVLRSKMLQDLPVDLLDPATSLRDAQDDRSVNKYTSMDGQQSAKTAEASQTASLWRELRLLGAKLGVLAMVSLLLLSFLFGLHYNADADMFPAIKDGDLVMYNRWSKDYSAGDLAVLSFEGQTQVRRVVAVAGDTVDITKDGLMINGALTQEREIFEDTQRYEGGINFPITLQEDEIFVLGDARGGATDSRIYGSVQVDDTRGTVMTLFRRRGL